jgi:hypothetical protein
MSATVLLWEDERDATALLRDERGLVAAAEADLAAAAGGGLSGGGESSGGGRFSGRRELRPVAG